MAKIKGNPMYKNYSVSLVENDVIQTYDVLDIVGDDIEYEKGFLTLADARKYFDANTGGIHYLYNVDLPAKVEAENLALLRRSKAIQNLFTYDRKKPFDLIGFMPWIITVLVVVMK